MSSDRKEKKGQHYSGIGGQAVLEGIMMKNKEKYSLAVRKQDGTIAVKTETYKGITGGKMLKVPFVRGIFAFIDSMVLGIKTLNDSAEYFEEDPEKPDDKKDGAKDSEKQKERNSENAMMGFVIVIAFALGIGLFTILPFYLSRLLKTFVMNESLLNLIEGLFRILIFIIYLSLISLMKDMQRVFMYHGAEHKCINCVEHGRPLNVENVMRSSRQHRRSGTSFLLYVMLISVVVFFFIQTGNVALKIVLRIVLIPVIAGISYEILRFAGRHNNSFIRALAAPGLWMQKLTTREPDESMAEVAIAAVEAVFDWKKYLHDEFGYDENDWTAYEDESENGV